MFRGRFPAQQRAGITSFGSKKYFRLSFKSPKKGNQDVERRQEQRTQLERVSDLRHWLTLLESSVSGELGNSCLFKRVLWYHEFAVHTRCTTDIVNSSRPRTNEIRRIQCRSFGCVLVKYSSPIMPDDLIFFCVRCESAGQIAASLAAFQRTIEDFDSMARREMMKAKQEKANMCAH